MDCFAGGKGFAQEHDGDDGSGDLAEVQIQSLAAA